MLGSCLIDRAAILLASELLRPGDFFRDAHRLIFEAMLRLAGNAVPADIVTLADELERAGTLAPVGGVAYVHSLATVVPTAIHLEHYANIVRRTSLKRQLISVAGRIGSMAYNDTTEPGEDLVDSLRLLHDVGNDSSRVRGGLWREYDEAADVIHVKPIPSQHRRWNWYIGGGYRAGVTYVVLAPPGSLKTAWLIDQAVHLVTDADVGVMYITNELPIRTMRMRFQAYWAEVPYTRVQRGELTTMDMGVESSEQARYEAAKVILDGRPLWMLEDVPTVEDIALEVVRARQQAKAIGFEGPRVLIVDYIQRLEAGRRRRDRRDQEISEAMDRLQKLAKREQMVLWVASSLATSDWKPDSDPATWAGKETGDIKGFTSVMLALQRDKSAEKTAVGDLVINAHITKNTLGEEGRLTFRINPAGMRWRVG